jgi:segregation and condensation protein B
LSPTPQTPRPEPADAGPSLERLRLLFALLFSSPEPVSYERIREVLYPAAAAGDPGPERFSPAEHLEALERWIGERNLPLIVRPIGKAWRLLTSEEVAGPLESVRRKTEQERLGHAGLEVLALVAYRQPVLKADIDAIRGVKSGPHLRHLLDLRLVRIVGRAAVPGRPFLYGTTREFLDRFGLESLSDLPEAGRLTAPAEQVAEALGAQEIPAEAAAELGECVAE